MKKITILALHLGYGGIERAISMLASSLVCDYEVEIISTYKLYDQPCFPLDKRIHVVYLIDRGPNRKEIKEALASKKIFSLIKEIIRAFSILRLKKKLMIKAIASSSSDIILSTRDIHNAWLSKYGKKGVYKIGWEHNHPNGNTRYARRIVRSVKDLDALVLVSKELYTFYQEKLKNKKCVPYYIPNAILKVSKEKASLKGSNLITVGRLSKEKGQIDLIKCMHLLQEKKVDFHLSIIGDGPLRKDIEKEIQTYHLQDKITLFGFQDSENVKRYLLSSSIFLLPSYTESFGIAVLEAFQVGVPVIAFDSAKGALELVQDQKNGYVVSHRDKEKMAECIVTLLNDKEKRKEMGKVARETARGYEIDIIKKKWVMLFEEGR